MIKFLEHRLGIFSAFRDAMSEKRPPQGIGFLRTIGFAALTVMVLQFLSGIALALHYIPTTELAYDSIRALENEDDIIYGTFIRALHHFGASAFVIFVALHMARVFFTGAYKAPREFTWLTGVGLFLIVLGFGFTGYLLPWDQKAYFATKVGTEIAADTPIIGEEVRMILRGGEDVGQPTLTRFYIIHVVLLPLALLGLLGLHFYLIQRHGVAAPKLPVGDEGKKGLPYFPHHTFKEALVGVVVAGGLFALSWFYPAPLEALAEPSDTSYKPRPDWYFYGLFELLNIFKGDLKVVGTFWIPTGFVVALILLPFIDRGKHRDWKKRRLMTPIGLIVCATIVTLTVMGFIEKPEAKQTGPDGQPIEAPAPVPPKIGDREVIDGLTLQIPLGYTNLERRGYLLVRRHKCMDCHNHVVGEDDPDKTKLLRVYGHVNKEFDSVSRLPDLDIESINDVIDVLEDSPEEMPSFVNVPAQDKIAIGAFILRFQTDFLEAQKAKKGK